MPPRFIKEATVKLRMLPVCECGYVFYNGIIIHKEVKESHNIKYLDHTIHPNTCPNCKKIIDCVEFDGSIVEHEDGNL